MKKTVMLFLFLTLGTFNAVAATYHFKPENGQVRFKAKGRPALITIKGEGEGVSSVLNELSGQLSGDITFKLSSLKTGIDLRDEHLKEKYLEVSKHPLANLKIQDLKVPNSREEKFKFTALLTLHGVSNPVEVSAILSGQESVQKIKADFKINLSQFKIEIPSFQGITVAEEVEVQVEVPVPVMKQDAL